MAHKPREPARASRPATLKTVAEALGLSISTVSRALQDDASVTARTRAKVMEVAEKLGYRRDLRGVNLRTGKTFTLCAVLVAPPSQEFGDPAAMHLIQGLITGVEGTDFKIVIRPIETAEQRFEAVKEVAANNRFDGLVLDHTEPQDAAVLYLLEKNIKFVTFGRTELFSEHPYLDIDNEDAAFVATKHLVDHGHERIAMIDPPANYLFCRQRMRGYRRALEEGGLPFDKSLIAEIGIGARRVRERVAQMLQPKARPTGFVTSNEVATLGAISAGRMLPPEEFSKLQFVSRDGTNLFDYFEPPVSSCYYSLLDAGEFLAGSLVKAVEGTPISALQTIERVTFIER
ncbi:MAG: LacI family DNA-binding transcriptional regulator, partial [Devosia sp.]